MKKKTMTSQTKKGEKTDKMISYPKNIKRFEVVCWHCGQSISVLGNHSCSEYTHESFDEHLESWD